MPQQEFLQQQLFLDVKTQQVMHLMILGIHLVLGQLMVKIHLYPHLLNMDVQ